MVVLKKTKQLVNAWMHGLEKRGVSGAEQKKTQLPPVIFIIGPPRSGSTLLFQLLVSAFDVGYFTNAHARWYGGISYYERFFRPLGKKETVDFSSEHGRTKGKLGPNECGQYWYQFFPRSPHFVDDEVEQSVDVEGLRNSLYRIRKAYGKPLVVKNLNCSLRLKVFSKVVPDALFIITHREIAETAHSILEGRKKSNGNYNEWWSVEPSNVKELRGMSPVEQVVSQYRQIYVDIEEAKKAFREEQFYSINYKNVCLNPHEEIRRVRDWVGVDKIKPVTSSNLIPERFERRQEVRIPEDMWQDLLQEVSSRGV